MSARTSTSPRSPLSTSPRTARAVSSMLTRRPRISSSPSAYVFVLPLFFYFPQSNIFIHSSTLSPSTLSLSSSSRSPSVLAASTTVPPAATKQWSIRYDQSKVELRGLWDFHGLGYDGALARYTTMQAFSSPLGVADSKVAKPRKTLDRQALRPTLSLPSLVVTILT